MKIRKFNENYNEDYLRKIIKEKDDIGNLIRRFSILENIYTFEKNDYILDYYYEKDLEVVGDKALIVTLENVKEGTLDSYMIFNEKLKDLYDFMNNPNEYFNVKKYNI